MSRSKLPVELIKRGRRKYGGIYTVADGRRAYLAYRKTKDIFRSGEKSISDAIRKGIATWAIDEEDLLKLRLKKVPFVGVICSDTGDIYLTSLDRFFDKFLARVLNYSSRAGSLQRHLPLQHFRYRAGS